MGAAGPSRLGSLPRRAMGVRTLLRLDVGFCRTMGVGAVSLWTLVCLQQFMVLVAGPGVWRISPYLGSSVRVILWIRPRVELEHWGVFRRRFWIDRLASDWTGRLLSSVVGRLPATVQRRRHPQRLQHT